MERKGKKLKVLQDGDRRRISDFKNAWRKASDDQRQELITWLRTEYPQWRDRLEGVIYG